MTQTSIKDLGVLGGHEMSCQLLQKILEVAEDELRGCSLDTELRSPGLQSRPKGLEFTTFFSCWWKLVDTQHAIDKDILPSVLCLDVKYSRNAQITLGSIKGAEMLGSFSDESSMTKFSTKLQVSSSQEYGLGPSDD